MVSFNLTVGAVEPHHLSQCLDPADDLDGVFFHPELPGHVDKKTDHPAYIKQLALERIGDIPIDAVQWIPFPVDLEGNEIADTLAKAGACEVPEPSAPLTFLEIFSRTKYQNKTAWIVPAEHHWYQCSRPGGSLAHGFKRQDQTLLARFRSGHLNEIFRRIQEL
ncbi:uncharacterized protein TNCV_4367371 [Trichonephila clavipes]|nr:uncharacterized protein TNCV_4367371 [Trichonephila clavipes]